MATAVTTTAMPLSCEIERRLPCPFTATARCWRYAISFLNFLRIFGFLPSLVGTVILLVQNRGGNTLAISLNTVAVLFLVEIDNLAFSHGLDEKTRKEASEFGRVHVSAEDERLLDIIKLVCVLTIPAVMLFEAFLSFLGLGIEPPKVSWGILAVDGTEAINPIRIYWWLVVFPALAMGSTLLALNVLGDGLRDALDPKLRGKD